MSTKSLAMQIQLKTALGTLRIGVCYHTQKRVLQEFDGDSDDAIDEPGWLCLHQESEEDELDDMLVFVHGTEGAKWYR